MAPNRSDTCRQARRYAPSTRTGTQSLTSSAETSPTFSASPRSMCSRAEPHWARRAGSSSLRQGRPPGRACLGRQASTQMAENRPCTQPVLIRWPQGPILAPAFAGGDDGNAPSVAGGGGSDGAGVAQTTGQRRRLCAGEAQRGAVGRGQHQSQIGGQTQQRVGRERIAALSPPGGEFGVHRAGEAGSIIATVGEDGCPLCRGDLDATGERKHVHDDHHIAAGCELLDALQSPFTAYIKAGLGKGHGYFPNPCDWCHVNGQVMAIS